MTAAAVQHTIQHNLTQAHQLLNQLIPALDLTPELTPTDPTSLKDVEQIVERLHRINQLTQTRRQQGQKEPVQSE